MQKPLWTERSTCLGRVDGQLRSPVQQGELVRSQESNARPASVPTVVPEASKVRRVRRSTRFRDARDAAGHDSPSLSRWSSSERLSFCR
jgi:hypothetical protein